MMIDTLLSKNLLPDPVIRFGIRRQLKERIAEEDCGDAEKQQERLNVLVEQLRNSPIAMHTDAANEQHYEVPTDFFRLVLGKHLKYSSGYWNASTTRLDQAEETMLAKTCGRAEIENGMQILELGCGWGSLSLFMAARYPAATITAVSNSHTQRAFIEEQCRLRSITNLTVVTTDMNAFDTKPEQYDRVVSVEMFEHMRNYDSLMHRISRWLKTDGKLFVHIFTHRRFAYPFEVRNDSDWMAKYFFTGGIMPSDDLLFYFNKNLQAEKHWVVNGTHYAKTARAWLENMDANRDKIIPILADTYGPDQVTRWWVYWRVFFMACEELWNYQNGNEWFVSHYLFGRRG